MALRTEEVFRAGVKVTNVADEDACKTLWRRTDQLSLASSGSLSRVEVLKTRRNVPRVRFPAGWGGGEGVGKGLRQRQDDSATTVSFNLEVARKSNQGARNIMLLFLPMQRLYEHKHFCLTHRSDDTATHARSRSWCRIRPPQ